MDEPDIRVLARLHMACLTDSFVTALGGEYVESFYRYVTGSAKEIALVERNAAGEIVGATVVSLEPESLNRWLLWHTSLLPQLVMHAPRMLAFLWPRRAVSSQSPAAAARTQSCVPEMLLIFTAEGERGRGVGSTLLRGVEDRLRELSVREYQVRTVMDPSNRALAFYCDRGFVPAGTDFRLGKHFQVLARRLD